MEISFPILNPIRFVKQNNDINRYSEMLDYELSENQKLLGKIAYSNYREMLSDTIDTLIQITILDSFGYNSATSYYYIYNLNGALQSSAALSTIQTTLTPSGWSPASEIYEFDIPAQTSGDEFIIMLKITGTGGTYYYISEPCKSISDYTEKTEFYCSHFKNDYGCIFSENDFHFNYIYECTISEPKFTTENEEFDDDRGQVEVIQSTPKRIFTYIFNEVPINIAERIVFMFALSNISVNGMTMAKVGEAKISQVAGMNVASITVDLQVQDFDYYLLNE